LELTSGSRVGVIGGGPAGSLVSYFLLEMAALVDLQVELDLYEPRDFSTPGPQGCNMCGGIISESLVQLLAADGINLPPTVVQRAIDSYVLHTGQGVAHISTPVEEMRIAALHRGAGPAGAEPGTWVSFDGYLLDLACELGATHIPRRVSELTWREGRPVIHARGGPERSYDLVIGAVGVNGSGAQLFQGLVPAHEPPRTTRAGMAEIHLGRDGVQQHLGSAMHVFLLDLPGLKFAAIIPKGEYATVCLLGRDVDRQLLDLFLSQPQVREILPGEWTARSVACRCLPHLQIGAAKGCIGDRVVLMGDCAASRLYKDGIGAAYRTAKAVAATAMLHGVSARDFRAHYQTICRRLERDNRIGAMLFLGAPLLHRIRCLDRGMLRMVRVEEDRPAAHRRMGLILWDLFTGSAPYRDVLWRCISPRFLLSFGWQCVRALPG
jgi:flavin-dependent dehydrogenase